MRRIIELGRTDQKYFETTDDCDQSTGFAANHFQGVALA